MSGMVDGNRIHSKLKRDPNGGIDAASGSGLHSTAPTTKAIGSLAKKQADVTRQGTQKLKFVPTLPARRKKDEVKAEPGAQVIPHPPERGRVRGRGRGEGRGSGRGVTRPVVEMTASGPFAMGPAMTGNNARAVVPRSNFAPNVPGTGSSAPGAGLSRASAPSLKKEKDGKGKEKAAEVVDDEVYSDPDEGVQIVDMENVWEMDWMAPESLKKEKHQGKEKKLRIKTEDPAKPADAKARADDSATDAMDIDDAVATGEVDLANALDLSDSEEEEELEDLIEDFAQTAAAMEEDPSLRQERLFFFQFPSPFPTFVPKQPTAPPLDFNASGPSTTPKKVSFAADAKPGSVTGSSRTSAAPPENEKNEPEPKVDGVIGQLEIYKSGAVRMRLSNGILLDVSAATQPSFLQHAVRLDMNEKRLMVLGEVNKRFVVSPNVEALLSAMEAADRAHVTATDSEEGRIRMETI